MSKINQYLKEHRALSITIFILIIALIGYIVYLLTASHTNFDEPVKLTEEVNSIKGMVIDDQSNPVEQATIDLNSYNQDQAFDIELTTTDSNGEFILNDIPVGEYILLAFKDNAAKAIRVTTTENSETQLDDIKLEPISKIEGTILDSDSNEPLPNALVKTIVSAWDNVEIVVTTGEDGKYAFYYLPEGTYEIQVCKTNADCHQLETAIEVKSGEDSTTDISYSTEKVTAVESTSTENSSTSTTNTSSNNSSTDNNDSDSDTSDDSTSTVSESKNLGGANVTVYRPDSSSSNPGILVLNGLNAESLANYGYYVVSHEPTDTEEACAIINAMKSQEHCSNSIGVTGSSWGGAMSMVIGSQCSVSAVAELYGLLHEANNIDLAAGDIPHPILFLTGENDTLASPADTENMYNQFIQSGYPGQFYSIPGVGHGYTGSEVYTKVLNFFGSYL